MKKRFMSLVLMLCLVALMVIPVGAAEASDNTIEGVCQEVVGQDIQELFENQEQYEIYDCEGNNISETFFEEYRLDYEQGNIDTIIEALGEEQVSIGGPTEYVWDKIPEMSLTSVVEPYLVVNVTVKHPVTSTLRFGDTTYKFEYSVYGSMKVNDYNYTIQSASAPDIKGDVKINISAPAVVKYSFTNKRNQKAVISDNSKFVTYSMDFTIKMGRLTTGETAQGSYHVKFDGYGDGTTKGR